MTLRSFSGLGGPAHPDRDAAGSGGHLDVIREAFDDGEADVDREAPIGDTCRHETDGGGDRVLTFVTARLTTRRAAALATGCAAALASRPAWLAALASGPAARLAALAARCTAALATLRVADRAAGLTRVTTPRNGLTGYTPGRAVMGAAWHGINHDHLEAAAAVGQLYPHGLGRAVQPVCLHSTRARLTYGQTDLVEQ